MKLFYLIILFLAPLSALSSPDTSYITDNRPVLLEKKRISVFKDNTGELPFSKITTLGTLFTNPSSIPNIGVTKGIVWLKFTLYNQTNDPDLLINLKKANLNYVRLYYPINNNGEYTYVNSGNMIPISAHDYQDPNCIFEVPVNPYSAVTLYLRVASVGQIVLPVMAGTREDIIRNANKDKIIFGIYLGIILIMFFYNFFIYFSVRDKTYLYYIVYIFFIGLAQFILEGYGYQLFWSKLPYISLQSVNWAGATSGIATALFLRVFLKTKKQFPAFDKILVGFITLYSVTILMTLLGLYNISYTLIDIIALVGSIAFLGAGIKLALDKFRPAIFFMIAWSFFLVGIILYVIKDFGVVPYNFFTNNILLIASSIEIALLSFALADTINTYKKEKEISQAQALQALREKEEFASQQNVVLEKKIRNRTKQLTESNKSLQSALAQLQESQSQLVNAEKMASLGQLTAGIAHEINNPINFVKSNVKPLRMDIGDLRSLIAKYDEILPGNLQEKLNEIRSFKKEIDLDYVMEEIGSLLSGIEDGANRTADIVKGLRTFSRLDESDLKEADVQDGIDTTLMLLGHTIPHDLIISKHYRNVPKIECYPGKLNQVFMNILTNAVQAIRSFPEAKEKKITISTESVNEQVVIRISDSGPGIPDEIKEKIFEPFFTTKEVGEGTGLGLSIVYSIIEKHQGKITVHSEKGKGTEFVITLPQHHHEPNKTNTVAETIPGATLKS